MKQPIFKSIFADNWEKLPKVMHKHYANRPYCNDIVTAQGKMDVEFGKLFTVLIHFAKTLKTLVPYRAKNIPVTVRFLSEPDSNAFCLERTFFLPNKNPYVFYSRMLPTEDNELIEFTECGIGWKHRFFFENGKVILRHKSYVLKILGKAITVPIGLILGKTYAEEESISDNIFRMKMTITHPIFGKIYEYRGEFTITEKVL